MEDGKLLAGDVLPKVAKELRKTAKSGGALDNAMDMNRISMNRMITAFQEMGQAFFESGFGGVMTNLFDGIRDAVVGLTPTVKVLSAVFSGFFEVVSLPLRLLAASIADLANMFGLSEVEGEKFISTMKTIGAVIGAVAAIFLVSNPIGLMVTGISLAVAGITLLISKWKDLVAWAKGAGSSIGNFFGFGSNSMTVNHAVTQASTITSRQQQSVRADVNVRVVDSEFSSVLRAERENTQQMLVESMEANATA